MDSLLRPAPMFEGFAKLKNKFVKKIPKTSIDLFQDIIKLFKY